MIYGCKLLRKNGRSLNKKYQYVRGEWSDVPGNGAYVAVTGGITAGGEGPLLAFFECDPASENLHANPRPGVRCFHRVRWIGAEKGTKKITPEIRVWIALSAPGLTPDQRAELRKK